MHWLYLLLAAGAVLLAITTIHGWLVLFSLLAAVVLFLAWIRGWYQERIGNVQQNEAAMIDPLELKRLRELAEARKRAAAKPASPHDLEPPSA